MCVGISTVSTQILPHPFFCLHKPHSSSSEHVMSNSRSYVTSQKQSCTLFTDCIYNKTTRLDCLPISAGTTLRKCAEHCEHNRMPL